MEEAASRKTTSRPVKFHQVRDTGLGELLSMRSVVALAHNFAKDLIASGRPGWAF